MDITVQKSIENNEIWQLQTSNYLLSSVKPASDLPHRRTVLNSTRV